MGTAKAAAEAAGSGAKNKYRKTRRPRRNGAACIRLSKKSVSSAAPADFAGQRLPLEGKLAAQPTDEVVSENGEKAGTFVKNAGLPPHPPSVRTGHLPLQGKA